MTVAKLVRKYWFVLLFVAIYLVFVGWGFRLLNRAYTMEYSDSADYHGVTLHSWTSPDFWAGRRTLTTPLIWKVFGTNRKTIIESHITIPPLYTMLSLFSWGLLAFALVLSVRIRWLKVASFILILAVGLSSPIFFWNWVLLSESPFISSFVLLLATGILMIKVIQRKSALSGASQVILGLALSGLIFFWSFTRDSNMLIGLSLAGILGLYFVLYRKSIKPKLLLSIIIAAFIAISLAQNATTELGRRWQYPFIDVLGQRILPNPDYRNYFIQHGLPDTPAVMQFSGAWADSHPWAGIDPWLYSRARHTYLQFLISHPSYTFLEPIRHSSELLDGDWLIYGKKTVGNSFQNRLSNYVWPRSLSLVVATLVAFLLTVIVAIRRLLTPYLILALVVLVLVIPGVLLAWHGDSREVVRHSLGNGLQLRLALYLMTIFSLDTLLYRKEKTD